jgi:hypothetical protein
MIYLRKTKGNEFELKDIYLGLYDAVKEMETLLDIFFNILEHYSVSVQVYKDDL